MRQDTKLWFYMDKFKNFLVEAVVYILWVYLMIKLFVR